MDMAEQTLVRNACGTPLRYVSWQRAVSTVVSGDAVSTVVDEDRQVRSAYLSMPWPLEITLVRYRYVPYVGYGGDPVTNATRRAILARDRSRCAYCGEFADTIDHVLPRSQGGLNTFENLVAACFDCNQKKADKTPEAAGMRLLWQPRVPDRQKDMVRAAKARR